MSTRPATAARCNRLNIPAALALLAGHAFIIPGVLADEPSPEIIEEIERAVQAQPKPRIQLAILLDTSGSMNGLIDQARTQIWSIVNEFATAKQDGHAPELQVALFHYGNNSLPAQEGYVQMLLPLTTDLDSVSEKLFSLTTNGGSEYCGWVVGVAAQALDWSTNPSDLRVIVVAGNEPFSQGPESHAYQQTIESAVRKGIIVNTIHCGDDAQGRKTGWYDGAILGEGQYSSIDHNAVAVHIPAPQDPEIMSLNTQLNATYVPYGGPEAEEASQRQTAQDANVTGRPSAKLERAKTKASANYTNISWDLIDALKAGKVKLEEMKTEDLPEVMRAMSSKERAAYVKEKTEERARIQKQIGELAAAREVFVAQKRREKADGSEMLGSALITALRQQAEQRNFTFDRPLPADQASEEDAVATPGRDTPESAPEKPAEQPPKAFKKPTKK